MKILLQRLPGTVDQSTVTGYFGNFSLEGL